MLETVLKILFLVFTFHVATACEEQTGTENQELASAPASATEKTEVEPASPISVTNEDDSDDPNPDDLQAELQKGVELYNQHCASCHHAIDNSQKLGATEKRIASAIENLAVMNALKFLRVQDIQWIALALNPEPKESGQKTPQISTQPPVSQINPRQAGADLYAQHCASCHLNLEQSQKYGASLEQINSAITDVTVMNSLSFLNPQEREWITLALSPVEEVTVSLVKKMPKATGKLLGSKLKVLFNQDSPNNTSSADKNQITDLIEQHVVGQKAFFGGRCHHLDTATTSESCVGEETVKNTFMKGANVLRSGYQKRFCLEILDEDRSVYSVLHQAQISLGAGVSSTDIAKLSKFTLSGRVLEPTQINSLMAVSQSASTAGLPVLDQWRFVTMSLCMSTVFDSL